MNYIRTKKEILSNSRQTIEDIDWVLTDQRGWIKKCNVVKQADTIPELCDEFIIDLKGHCVDAEYDAFRLYEDFKETYLDWKKYYPDVVGCGSIIARDKNGCIIILPVAKANDTGELELV